MSFTPSSPLSTPLSTPLSIRPSSRSGNGVFTTRAYAEHERVCFYDGVVSHTVFDPDYMLGSVVGHRTVRQPEGVAQLVNDAACPWFDNDSVSHIASVMRRYVLDSQNQANIHQSIVEGDARIWFVAKRCLPAGTELFLHYGSSYWLTWWLRRSTLALGEARTAYERVRSDIEATLLHSNVDASLAIGLSEMSAWLQLERLEVVSV